MKLCQIKTFTNSKYNKLLQCSRLYISNINKRIDEHRKNSWQQEWLSNRRGELLWKTFTCDNETIVDILIGKLKWDFENSPMRDYSNSSWPVIYSIDKHIRDVWESGKKSGCLENSRLIDHMIRFAYGIIHYALSPTHMKIASHIRDYESSKNINRDNARLFICHILRDMRKSSRKNLVSSCCVSGGLLNTYVFDKSESKDNYSDENASTTDSPKNFEYNNYSDIQDQSDHHENGSETGIWSEKKNNHNNVNNIAIERDMNGNSDSSERFVKRMMIFAEAEIASAVLFELPWKDCYKTWQPFVDELPKKCVIKFVQWMIRYNDAYLYNDSGTDCRNHHKRYPKYDNDSHNNSDNNNENDNVSTLAVCQYRDQGSHGVQNRDQYQRYLTKNINDNCNRKYNHGDDDHVDRDDDKYSKDLENWYKLFRYAMNKADMQDLIDFMDKCDSNNINDKLFFMTRKSSKRKSVDWFIELVIKNVGSKSQRIMALKLVDYIVGKANKPKSIVTLKCINFVYDTLGLKWSRK